MLRDIPQQLGLSSPAPESGTLDYLAPPSTHFSLPNRNAWKDAASTRLRIDPEVSVSKKQIACIEALLPEWLSELTLTRRSFRHRRRDLAPEQIRRGKHASTPLIATIRLGARPPVGAVQELQLKLHALLGEWPFRHVVSDFALPENTRVRRAPEALLRKEVLRTLPLGHEMIRLEEFLLSSKGIRVRFLVLKVFSPPDSSLLEWKQNFESDHGTLIFVDAQNTPPTWVQALKDKATHSNIVGGADVSRLARRLLSHSPLPAAVSHRRPSSSQHRIDLTDRQWFRVDSKECLIAEDIFHIERLPNGHTELLVGVVDTVSKGRPPDVSGRRWGSFTLGEERNAVVSRFEFDQNDSLCGFWTKLARAKAHLKFTLNDLEDLLRSNSSNPFVTNLEDLDRITSRLGSRRLNTDGVTEVSSGGSPGKLVFEPMVLFNSANAQWLRSKSVPLLYRATSRVPLAERRALLNELTGKGFPARVLERPDPLHTLLMLQQLEEAGERDLCHRILDGYIRSSRYSTEEETHPSFARPYTGFKPKGGSGFNQLQLVSYLSGTNPLDEPTLRAEFVSMQGRGPLVAYSRSDREALTGLAKLFERPGEAREALVTHVSPRSSADPHVILRLEGWDRLAVIPCTAGDLRHFKVGARIEVRPLGFDLTRLCPIFEASSV